MLKSYEYFTDKLYEKIKNDDLFYFDLLVTVIKNPQRYTGIFRLSNAKTKLIQNVTQSREIKFGDFMEDIITEYICAAGFTNLSKNIGKDEDKNVLSADQVFYDSNTVYLVEQKIRDDHDSTKKRGQYQNFKKKFSLLRKTYPTMHIIATMWFVDDCLQKNKAYYLSEAATDCTYGLDIHISYGSSLFDDILHCPQIWIELCRYLERNKNERNSELIHVPDFDTSDEMLKALKRLQTYHPKLISKLLSDAPEYIQLRKELFTTGYNLDKLNK